MSNRELVIDLINKLPADTLPHDIAREIEFIAGVKEAIAESDREDGVSVEEARQLLEVCPAKSSSCGPRSRIWRISPNE